MNLTWHNEKRKISELIPYVANPRQITEKQSKDLKASLDKFGVADPIIINTTNEIIGGHQRKKILESLVGVDPDFEIDVRVPDRELTIDECRELNVRLNKNSGQWDFDILANNFDLDDLLDWGFEKSELDLDLWVSEDGETEAHKTLADRFVVPPFSVLDGRLGYWQERKRSWINLGIRSEIGRGNAEDFSIGNRDVYLETGDYTKDRIERERLSNLNNAPPLPEWAQGNNRVANMAPGTSVFDPVLCELVYRWFMPGAGKILDPFAGGSVRGLVAGLLGHNYTGIELRPEQVISNNDQLNIVPENKPVWIVGDSANVTSLAPDEYDLIFSCPPYYDLEVYSDTDGELSAIGTYEEFIDAYRHIIFESVSMLKNDRFACFVVGDIRDNKGLYRNFVSDTISAFIDAGMALYNEAIFITPAGTLPIRITRQFQSGRKLGKTHQNVLIFYKGDPKAIKTWGDVECGDIEAMTGGEPELVNE